MSRGGGGVSSSLAYAGRSLGQRRGLVEPARHAQFGQGLPVVIFVGVSHNNGAARQVVFAQLRQGFCQAQFAAQPVEVSLDRHYLAC